MRVFIFAAVYILCLNQTDALASPPLDSSPAFFTGEWSGTGPRGGYCYVNMNRDGSVVALINGGTGDWLGARFYWHNLQQSIEVKKIIPLPFSSQFRVMPLQQVTLRSGFNLALTLNGGSQAGTCQLQKTETAAHNLSHAHNIFNSLK